MSLSRMINDALSLHLDNTALKYDSSEWTYRELLHMSDHYLRLFKTNNVQKNDIVLIQMGRTASLFAAVLGILRAGAAYLIIDNETSPEFMYSIMKEVKYKVLISEESDRQDHRCNISDEIYESFCCEREEDSLAYVVFTSGTSGINKPIYVTDSNIQTYIEAYFQIIKPIPHDVMIQQSPLFYDGFAEEFFCTLLSGATLVLTETQNLRSAKMLHQVLRNNQVTIWPSTPLMIEQIAKLDNIESIRVVISSGDVLRLSQIEGLIKNRKRVINMYGTSETTVCATWHEVDLTDEYESNELPIGQALPGYDVKIVKKQADNLYGEILIGGKALSLGYSDRASWEEKITEIEGEKYYRTGDFAHVNENGVMSFYGRMDRQTKIRANRIDLSSIERELSAKIGTSDVVALKIVTKASEYLGIAYLKGKIQKDLFVQNCQAVIAKQFEPYFVEELAEIPLGETGKIDKRQLEIVFKNAIDEKHSLFVKNIEVDVFNALKESVINPLGTEFTEDEDFIKFGLDSFGLIEVLIELEEKYGIEIDLGGILIEEINSVRKLSRFISNHVREIMNVGYEYKNSTD